MRIYKNIFKNFFDIKKKIFFFLSIILLVSCSKNNEQLVDLNSFIKQGKKIEFSKNEDLLNKNIYLIKDIRPNYETISNWSQSNLNSNNYVPAIKIDVTKIKKKINKKFLKAISFRNFLVGIDISSNLILMNTDLKIIKQRKIYKKNIKKKYDLKFSILHLKNKIIVSDNIGNIQAFDDQNLDKKWQNNLSVPFKSELKSYKNKIYVINANSKIYSFNVDNGEIIWSFITSSKLVKSDDSYQISILNDKLVFSNDYGEIYCLDLLKQKLLWSVVLETSVFDNVSSFFKSNPITIIHNRVFFSTSYGFTYSLDLSSGEKKWSIPISTEKKMLFLKNNFLLITKSNFLVVNKNDGKILFNIKLNLESKNNDFSLEDMFIGQDNIFIFSNKGDLFLVKKNNLKSFVKSNFLNSFHNYLIVKNKLVIISDNSLNIF